ncbi:hypothetical protein ACWEQ1_02520 [Streptomyces nodosus]
MKQAGALTAAVILVAWLVWNLWNLFHIATGLQDRSWRRPLWWTRLCSVSLFGGLACWIWGGLRQGLIVSDACLVRHQPYDKAYWDSHAEEFGKFFPLHNKCNAHFDLVPVWVNPAIVVSGVVSLAAVAVLLWFGSAYLTSLYRKETQS